MVSQYRKLKSRRQFLQNVIFVGLAFALSGTLWAANDNNAPLATSPMPQPDANIYSVAFSSTNRRMAVSAGPYAELTSLYINTPDNPEKFKAYWSPETEVHAVGSMAWSGNEENIAFIGMSGSRTTKTGEVCIYVLDTASNKIRKVLTIIEADNTGEHRLVNVHEERAVLAWFGNNKICMPTKDGKSIIAVDCNDGHIETVIPQQDCKILGPVSVSPNKLRFLKRRPTGQGWELEICDFNSSEVTSLGIIPVSSESTIEWLSIDGKYVMIATFRDNKVSIFDVSQKALVKEIPLFAASDSATHQYAPVAILEREQLVLIETIRDKTSQQERRRLSKTKL